MLPIKEHFLADKPALSGLVDRIDQWLVERHPAFFGQDAVHPALPLKRFKGVHDNLWGTNRFLWRELALIDSPIIQRLRGIHQTGLAYQIYPSIRHTRFEHCLGVTIVSSRVFDAVLQNNKDDFRTIATAIAPDVDVNLTIQKLKQETRLAALLHDTGHSLFSHTSESVYKDLSDLKSAAHELTDLIGKRKGAGEVISFCIALTDAVSRFVIRAGTKLIGDLRADDYDGDVDWINVAMMIVGRSRHPFLQFLGDIVSSGFDADKLDYLLRDATAAGLPLRYDMDRYLYSVRLDKTVLADGEDKLEKLYGRISVPQPSRNPPIGRHFPSYDTYRLRLPRQAMNTIEQIVICKLMLFSYIYHHTKVRAAEGLLERILRRYVDNCRSQGVKDEAITLQFLEMTDAALSGPTFLESENPRIKADAYRIVTRLLPREVFRLSGAAATHAEGINLKDFLTTIVDPQRRDKTKWELEKAIGEELLKNAPDLGKTPEDALFAAGVWVDVPSAPKFEDVDEIVIGEAPHGPGVPLLQLFPISHWTDAYTHYRYSVRVFAFSEYSDLVEKSGKAAMKRIIKIYSEAFYSAVRRNREGAF